jgi:glycerophosphoryl diester phosphodiesterase
MILLDPLAHPVIAHRGNRAFAPENTLAAFAEAVALGADAIEFDVQMSRDGVPMVMHDSTLERTTDGRGAVLAHSAAELARLDAGTNFTRDGGRSFPWRARGVGIASFDEVIESLPRTLPCIVELKSAAASEPVRRAIERHAIGARVIVAGFDPEATRPLRGSGLALGASSPDVVQLLPRALLGLRNRPAHIRALCIPPRWHGLHVPISLLAHSLRGSGVVCHVWTINDAAHALRLWRGGVQGVISDDPALILRTRSEAGLG